MPKQRALLLAGGVFSAWFALPLAAVAFDHIIGGPGRDGVRKMTSLADGGAAAIGWQAQQGIYQDGAGILLRLDKQGHIVWSRALTSSGHNQGAAVTETPDGRLLISLEEYPQDSAPGQVIIVEVSADGSVLGQTPVGGPGHEVADVIQVLPDGQLLLGGEQSPAPNQDMAAWITRLDLDFTPVWDWTLNTEGRDRINAVLPLDNGSFIAAGNSTSVTGGLRQEQALLAGLSGDGEETWVSQPDVGRPASIRALAEVEDNGALFAGYAKRPETGEFDAWIGRVASNGELRWHVPMNDDGPAFFHSLILLPTGDAVAAGAIRPEGSSAYHGLLVRFTPDGEILSETRVSRAGSAQIRALVLASEARLRVAGSLTPDGTKNEQLWITETLLP